MPLKMTIFLYAICAFFAAGISVSPAATRPGVVEAAYGDYSVAPPTSRIVFVCHGFGCKYRAEWDLTDSDRAKLAQVLAAGRPSPAAGPSGAGPRGAPCFHSAAR